MKHLISNLVAIVVVGIFSTQVIAQAQPTTSPSISPRVEIFAFSPISSQPAQTDWIGRGIQESLQTEISHTGATLLIPVHSPAATDDAVTVARQNKADLAVIGTYQVVGDDVRVNGHLLDAVTNTTVGSFSATGPQKNLFSMEDALGEQLRRLLPAPAAPVAAQPVAAAVQPQAPTSVYQEPQQIYSSPPAVNSYYDTTPDDGYYYPNTYYGYSPFGFYGGIGIYGGGYYRGGYRGYNGGGNRGAFAGHTSPGFAGHVGGLSVHGSFGGGHAGGGGRR